jgi:hypothetical protein
MPLQASSILSDIVKYVRDDLNNITDPLTARSGGERFVMTSYPQRPVKYPIITVQVDSMATDLVLGMQSTSQYVDIPIEIRIWARNEKEKDGLTDSVLNRIRTNLFTATTGYRAFGLHDYRISSMVNVDEAGDAGIKSRVISIKFKAIYGDTC